MDTKFNMIMLFSQLKDKIWATTQTFNTEPMHVC